MSQIELVKYIDDLDEQMKNARVKDILYDEYLKKTGKKTRKTKADKRYVVIASLVRDNFKTQIGDTTVWRVLRIKHKSKKVFEEMLAGDVAIKEAYYKVFPQKEKGTGKSDHTESLDEHNPSVQTSDTGSRDAVPVDAGSTAAFDFSSDDDILDALRGIQEEFKSNSSNHLSNKRLNEIDDELFKLRRAVLELMRENDM